MVAVIAFVLVWWLLSGNGPQGPDGNDPVLAVPDVDASGEPGATDSPVPVALANGLRLTSYAVSDGDRLTLEVEVPRGTCPEVAGAASGRERGARHRDGHALHRAGLPPHRARPHRHGRRSGSTRPSGSAPSSTAPWPSGSGSSRPPEPGRPAA